MLEDTVLNEEPVPEAQGTETGQAVGRHPAFPVVDDPARSNAHGVCPFLRGPEGPLAAPATTAVDGQLCIAIGPPRAQSPSQQQLVCLRNAHADCPRYQRGALEPPERGARSRPAVPRATLAALLILVLSAGISFGYVVQRGGLEMPAVAEGVTPSPDAMVTPASEPPATELPATIEPTDQVPVAGASGKPALSPAATPAAEATAPPVATPTAEVTAAPTPKPTARPTSKPKPSATPRSDRYKLLVKCPDRAGCWIYRIRSGDNLFSIARYFGHSLQTIYTWNPQYPGTRLKAGAEVRMPPPTR